MNKTNMTVQVLLLLEHCMRNKACPWPAEDARVNSTGRGLVLNSSRAEKGGNRGERAWLGCSCPGSTQGMQPTMPRKKKLDPRLIMQPYKQAVSSYRN